MTLTAEAMNWQAPVMTWPYEGGTSCGPVRDKLALYVIGLAPETVFDLGCGAGWYGYCIKDRGGEKIRMIGLDGWGKNLTSMWCAKLYDITIRAKIDDWMTGLIDVEYDIMLCNDVIEHLPRVDGLLLLDQMESVILTTPLFEYRNEAIGGNELEIHRTWYTEKDLDLFGYKLLFKMSYPAFPGAEGGYIGAFTKGLP